MGEGFTFHQTMLFGTLVYGIYFVLRVMNEGLFSSLLFVLPTF